MKKTLSSLTIILFASLIFSGMSFAAVCSSCHTMHNMQGGEELVVGGPSNSLLIATSCVACHTGTNTVSTTVPYVLDTSEPTFGTNTLAGGNFWWVATAGGGDDAKGHNVLGVSAQDTNITAVEGAPGDANTCADSCHKTLAVVPTSDDANSGGCEACHLNPAHHTSSSGNVSAAPWYRFLSGHDAGDGYGVKGIEHSGWGYGATAGGTNHNEYLGVVGTKTASLSLTNYNMTAYCSGCHGNFHIQDATATGLSPWTRHPADSVIPGTAGTEYASMSTSYNPNTPVARPSLSAISATVTPGTDMVMCLSCHVAHGSPYDDMLRWDYSLMDVGGGSNTTGCFVCHTAKDGVAGN